MKYTLKAQSINVLRLVLHQPGYAKTLDQIYRGGKLLAEGLPEIKDGSPADKPVEIELDGPSRDLVKLAIEHAVEKQILPVTKYAADIIEALELVTGGKEKKK